MIISRRELSVPTAAIFFRQLAAMVAAGVPIRKALYSVAEDNSDVSRLAQSYLDNAITERGNTDFFKRVFNYVEKKSEPDKNIAKALYSIADEIDKYREFKVAMSQILFIPIMTLILSVLVLSVLLVFVVPVWQELFESYSSRLPGPTLLVITISKFIVEFWYIIAGFIFVFVGVLVIKWESLAAVFSLLPIARRLFVYQSVVRFTRYLSVLLHIEVPLKEAATLAADEVRNRTHGKVLKDAVRNMDVTTQLSSPLKLTGYISTVVGQIIDTGEKSGTLTQTLNEVSVLYEKEADIALAKTVYWSDILIKFVVGAIVGTIVISMYLPIFKLAGAVG